MIDKLVKYRILTTILFFGLQFIWLFAREWFETTEDFNYIPWICFFLLIVVWLIIFIDILRTSIYNKTFWIITMIVVPFLAPVFYLFQRKKLIHLQNNKFNQ